MFKRTPEERAADEALAARITGEREIDPEPPTLTPAQAARLGPVDLAETLHRQGRQVFQVSVDLLEQEAVIVPMVGSATRQHVIDPNDLLNAICAIGWDLVSASMVFVSEGEQSRDKFLSSGQNVAVEGRTVGYYVFRRASVD